MSPARIAVVGRPNVGKSTLVNRLIGRRRAIVEERPGVTRDQTEHPTTWRGVPLLIVDTGGWTRQGGQGDELQAAVVEQAERAATSADLILFVVDLTVGVTEGDAAAARWLRSVDQPVVLVANKADALGSSAALHAELAELYALGMGDPLPVSALHGRGSGDLLDTVVERLGPDSGRVDTPPAKAELVAVALIGRPNVGKSSLFNRLVGAERAIVDHRPGTTRDVIDALATLPDGRRYRFVDTAGLRRKLRHRDATEYYSTVRTGAALEAADVAVLVIDAIEGVGEQNQRLARRVLDAGRGLVIVLNKWDLVDEEAAAVLEREFDRLLGFVSFAPVLRTSAVTGRGVGRLPDTIDAVDLQWRRRIQTSQLNGWLAGAVAATAPPMQAGRPVRLRYVTQVATGPPTFRVFSSGPLPPAYIRYLERRLRERFGFEGAPLRVGVRVQVRDRTDPGRRRTRGGAGRRRSP